MSSADMEEERRIQRARKRKQIQREMWQMLQQSAGESAADMVRWIGWIVFFIVMLTIMTPQQ